MKKQAAKITRNQYGNFRGQVGKESSQLGDFEFDALFWLSERVEEGCSVAATSYYSAAEVAAFRAKLTSQSRKG